MMWIEPWNVMPFPHDSESIINNKPINVFTKDLEKNIVINNGLFYVKGFRLNKKYVCLEKQY